ncbi:DNA methyltransferase [Streptomyces longwoodensis]|uniref:DNA methyltransferase n=1 Tax=Streptomyces longwoodensis TaxID=68231 RepID=UPI0022519AF4|nr:DNA methyltransferase [Streptomyces longwoodensis]MCX5000922.1 site-specific DNA-methyltransferase [Streptomyces longwoodensis]
MIEPYYRSDGATLYRARNLHVLQSLPDAGVDAVICDPPYEIGIGGQAWDRTGAAFDVALWRECLRLLKPGGHLLAFGHVRTQHRLTCAIEDAGFQIRDCIDWIYGQGYPGSKTQLKPAREPITVARKPFRGTETANIAAHGVGGLNVQACRTDTGRWPANLLLGHHPECGDGCRPGSPSRSWTPSRGYAPAAPAPSAPRAGTSWATVAWVRPATCR